MLPGSKYPVHGCVMGCLVGGLVCSKDKVMPYEENTFRGVKYPVQSWFIGSLNVDNQFELF